MTNSPKMAPSAPANEPADQPLEKQAEPKVETAPLKPAAPAETKNI